MGEFPPFINRCGCVITPFIPSEEIRRLNEDKEELKGKISRQKEKIASLQKLADKLQVKADKLDEIYKNLEKPVRFYSVENDCHMQVDLSKIIGKVIPRKE